MSRPPQLEPAWLIGLLLAWSRRTEGIGAGYPTECIYLKERIGEGVHSYDPTGYGTAEIQEVGRRVGELPELHRMAVIRYCKPWMVNAIDFEFPSAAKLPGMWLALLKEALATIAEAMDKRVIRYVG